MNTRIMVLKGLGANYKFSHTIKQNGAWNPREDRNDNYNDDDL